MPAASAVADAVATAASTIAIASITIAAREMKLKGWLDYSRGHIVIQNLEALNTLAAA